MLKLILLVCLGFGAIFFGLMWLATPTSLLFVNELILFLVLSLSMAGWFLILLFIWWRSLAAEL